jgi:predicted transcriptional regulator
VVSAREDIAYLVGSNCRIEILRALDDELLGPSALAERASCARETAQRNLAGFAERDWVAKEDKAYRLTAAGRMVLDRYDQLERTVESADQLSTFLANCEGIVDRVDPDLLAEQTITTSTVDNPHAPIERWLRLVDGVVDRYYGMTPIVSEVFNQAAESAIGAETEMELIIDESVLETSREEFPDALDLAFDLDQFTLWLLPETVEFGMAVVDGSVWVAAYDSLGNVVASVDGDDDRFVDWALDCYDDYRERATVVEREQIPQES